MCKHPIHRLITVMLIAAVTTTAQVAFSRSASAQTVQLPTFHRFSYSGSVLVPTGGSASLGGVSSSAYQQSRLRGRSRAIGAGLNHAGATAHVTIIDHEAIDRQLRGLPPKGAKTKPANSAQPKRKSTVDPDAEGKMLVRFARKKYLAGEKASAFDAYHLAISCLSPKLAHLAQAEFERVFPDRIRPADTRANRFAAANDRQ